MKIGDKVKIVNNSVTSFNLNDIGTIVKIDDSDATYGVQLKPDGLVQWFTKEAIKLENLIDYTRCHPTIRENLENNLKTYCSVCDYSTSTYPRKKNVIGYIESHSDDSEPRYLDEEGVKWKFAEPITKKTVVRKASEIVKWMEDKGWTVDCEGTWESPDLSQSLE